MSVCAKCSGKGYTESETADRANHRERAAAREGGEKLTENARTAIAAGEQIIATLTRDERLKAWGTKWRDLAMRVTSAAWSLSQWNDHNFTHEQRERWRTMTEERCLEVEQAMLDSHDVPSVASPHPPGRGP